MFIKRSNVMVYTFSMATNSVNLSKNYYKILEVDLSSDQKLIKNSYLKLVKVLHPDVNPNGKQKFTQVQEAYEILSDKQLKEYYDQNSSFRGGNSGNPKYPNNNSSGSQSKYNKTSSGQQYQAYRTYKSQNPHDYYYNQKNQNQYKKKPNYQSSSHDQRQDKQNHEERYKKYDRQQKKARSHASYEELKRRQKQQQQQKHQHESAEQRVMRDKLKAIRGFASSYNVLGSRYHINYNNLMNNQQKQKQNKDEIRNLFPQKVKKYYDIIKQLIQRIAKQ